MKSFVALDITMFRYDTADTVADSIAKSADVSSFWRKLYQAEQERRKEAYLDKLGRGYIAYLKKYYPELL